MARVIYVPIERLEQRYSAQWDDWFQSAFKREGIEYIRVGDSDDRTIKHGEFLDVFETNHYKAQQMQEILEIIAENPKIPTVVFFMDIWFPGIQSLFYLREGMKLPLKIKGVIHAGTYDPWDFLAQKQMQPWGLPFEASILKGADEVFCATQFHSNLIAASGLPIDKLSFVDWPVECSFEQSIKENIVVFPHRLAPEKNPEGFDRLQHMFEAKYGKIARWIKSAAICNTKAQYYDLLARSKVAVSTAWQETFGIAMVEAINNGCIPVAPNRLSYPEVLKHSATKFYVSDEEAVEMIKEGLTNYELPQKIKGKELLWVNQILN